MEQFAATPEKRQRAKTLCVVAVVAVLIATLSPFNPRPRNQVTWLQGAHGLKFGKAGLVVSDAPLTPAKNQSPESFTLELLLRPTSTKSVYTIFGVYVPDRPNQLLVRQWKDSLLVTHNSAVDNDRTRTIKFDVDHIFHPGTVVLVAISSGPNGTAVFLDGQLKQSFPFKISRSELSGQIVLGSSPVIYHPWPGELRGLAIYSNELTPAVAMRHYQAWIDPSQPADLNGALARFTFAEGAGREVHNEVPSGPNLEIPAAFSVPHKDMLRSVAKEFKANTMYAIDILMNIAGFIPLGLIICAYLIWTRSRPAAILLATAACGILSFVIEVLQFYIPSRGSGTTDIITNTLGAALGAALIQSGAVRHILEEMKLIPSAQLSGVH